MNHQTIQPGDAGVLAVGTVLARGNVVARLALLRGLAFRVLAERTAIPEGEILSICSAARGRTPSQPLTTARKALAIFRVLSKSAAMTMEERHAYADFVGLTHDQIDNSDTALSVERQQQTPAGKLVDDVIRREGGRLMA